VRVTVRLEGYIHAQLVRLARDQKRSVSFVVRRLIIDAVRRHRESQG
jgi:predicted transcriptional regulator